LKKNFASFTFFASPFFLFSEMYDVYPNQYMPLALLKQMFWQLCFAFLPTAAVAVSHGVLFCSNAAYYDRKKIVLWGDALWHGFCTCWPLWIFCAIVPVTWSWSSGVGIINISLTLVLTLFCCNENARRNLEHNLILNALVVAGCVALSHVYEIFSRGFDDRKQASPVQLVVALMMNAFRAAPILFGLGMASVESFVFNPTYHEKIVYPQTAHVTELKKWEDYSEGYAFVAGLAYRRVARVCLCFCTIVPISWTFSLTVAAILLLIPFVVALLTYDDNERLNLEVRLMFFANVCAAIIPLRAMYDGGGLVLW
jgi:hypothetical protein